MVGDRFEIQGLAGRGGMAELYSAVDLDDGRRVALKRLVPAFAGDLRMRASFATEAAALRELRVAGVPRFVAEGMAAGTPFIVMQWLPGIRLTDWRAGGRVRTVGETVMVLAGALRVLASIHASGWVHGDVAPGNVLVSSQRGGVRVSLVDLGLARREGESGGPSEVCGTPPYMAPELLHGARATVATDLYAAGAMLDEILRGAPGRCDALRETARWASAQLPSARPASAVELRAALIRALSTDDVEAPLVAPDRAMRSSTLITAVDLDQARSDTLPLRARDLQRRRA